MAQAEATVGPEQRVGKAADGARAVLERVAGIAAAWAEQRKERQQRRELDPADFRQLADAGFLRCAVPAEQGGFWEDVARSTRPIGELLRTLARADSSVALVSAMHPSVLGFWLTNPRAPEPHAADWDAQRRQVCQTAMEGAWWGTITSEPGSGGDMRHSRSVARRAPADGAAYRLTGDKHFGSGSGVTSSMLTVAVPEGEAEADLFYLDVLGAPWDGSTGMRLVAPWDGHGMIATQSHAFRFDDFPATRFAWPGNMMGLGAAAQPFIRCCFTAVVLGVLEVAIATARDYLSKRRESLGPYEQVEWARVEMDCWLAQQAYEGMLRAVESGQGPGRATLHGKLAVSELAESAMTRLCRLVGGGTFARSSPFGAWAQDVRALGFLRPPWGLTFSALLDDAWAAGE